MPSGISMTVSTLSDYVGYGDNADRIRAIGEVISDTILHCGGIDQSDNDDADG